MEEKEAPSLTLSPVAALQQAVELQAGDARRRVVLLVAGG
jgi:hypothetical protein